MRRISVNSFGFGGSNAHAVLDDALQYMRANNMQGFYRSITYPECVQADPDGVVGSLVDEIKSTTGHSTVNGTVNGDHAAVEVPRLLVWSAAGEFTINGMLQAYDQYYSTHIAGRPHKLNQLAYTLAARRSIMPWRSFSVVGGNNDCLTTEVTDESSGSISSSMLTEKPLRANADKTGIAFVFTGQGAQYVGMGLGLMHYTIFEESLRRSDEILKTWGCEWSLFGQFISNPRFISGISAQAHSLFANIHTHRQMRSTTKTRSAHPSTVNHFARYCRSRLSISFAVSTYLPWLLSAIPVEKSLRLTRSRLCHMSLHVRWHTSEASGQRPWLVNLVRLGRPVPCCQPTSGKTRYQSIWQVLASVSRKGLQSVWRASTARKTLHCRDRQI